MDEAPRTIADAVGEAESRLALLMQALRSGNAASVLEAASASVQPGAAPANKAPSGPRPEEAEALARLQRSLARAREAVAALQRLHAESVDHLLWLATEPSYADKPRRRAAKNAASLRQWQA